MSEVEIRCTDGSFMFYPHTLSITLTKSRFNKKAWNEPFITLDYEINDVKELFGIYLSKKLPSAQSLIRGGLLVICYGLSDYLGVKFYANYFGEIIHSISFARIVFPAKGSVENYTELHTRNFMRRHKL